MLSGLSCITMMAPSSDLSSLSQRYAENLFAYLPSLLTPFGWCFSVAFDELFRPLSPKKNSCFQSLLIFLPEMIFENLKIYLVMFSQERVFPHKEVSKIVNKRNF